MKSPLANENHTPIKVYANGIVAFPERWQNPARTEQHAFECVLSTKASEEYLYIGFPWATLIDGLMTKLCDADRLVYYLNSLRASCGTNNRVVTTVQHIGALDFIRIFKACRVTDIFWPHKLKSISEYCGIQLHPFPLYPAQTADMKSDSLVSTTGCYIQKPRRYLANFIGAYNPAIYISNVRSCILADAGRFPDILIVKRGAWHFDRTVYQEQMKNIKAEASIIEDERQKKDEYLSSIRESTFTLCPTGSGPSSIRIYESIALGSIPVILSQELHLPCSQALWEEACVFEEDSEKGYDRSISRIRSMSDEEKERKRAALRKLLRVIEPAVYDEIIYDRLIIR